MTWLQKGTEVERRDQPPASIKRDHAFRGWRWPSGKVYKTDLQLCREGK